MLTQQKVANDMLQTTRSSYEGDLQQQEQELSMLCTRIQQVVEQCGIVWGCSKVCGWCQEATQNQLRTKSQLISASDRCAFSFPPSPSAPSFALQSLSDRAEVDKEVKKLIGMVTYLEAEIDRVSKEEASLKIYNHVGICFRSVVNYIIATRLITHRK